MRNEFIRKDLDKVSPARRHFFHVMGALAGAAVLPALSKQAQAEGPSRGSPGPGSSGPRGGPACMLQGTRVLTSRGTEPVENLSIGDNVLTSRGEAKPIKWIGRRRFTQGLSSRWPDSVHPIRVARSTLADNVPHADLYLSPMHALFIDGVLIPVKDLVNGTSITRSVPEGIQDIEYFHIELETHEVILAEGAPVETLLVTDGRENFTNFVEYERLYGGKTGRAMVACAPVLGYPDGRAHLKALLRLAVSQVVDVRDPVQVAYDRIAARATNSCLLAS
jgi:hypothetical protein